MKNFRAYFLGICDSLEIIFPLIPLFGGLFLLLTPRIISTLLSKVFGVQNNQTIAFLEEMLVAGAFFLFGIQGLIFAKYGEFPVFMKIERGKVARLLSLSWTVICFAIVVLFISTKWDTFQK
jgi:hypothetical protein